ncbi:MAG: hypothetical protein ACI4MJ_09285 [Aristaeellaceae bacterium]
MITIATECYVRKEMVRKLSGLLNRPAIYLRAPTYAFRIGGITVNRDASVSGERDEMMPVARFLMENGYISEMPAGLDEPQANSGAVTEVENEPTEATETVAEEEQPTEAEAQTDAEPDTATADEQPADSEAVATPEADTAPATATADITEQIDRIAVSIPLTNCTPQGLINILRTLYARQSLIAAMTQCDFLRMDEEVIELLDDPRPESLEQIAELLRQEAEIGMVTGIAVEEDKLKLDTTWDRENPTGWNSFAELLSTVAARAMKAHHVSSKRMEPLDSEMKYFCRSWLMQLGMGGAEYKATRAALLKHLHGYAAFRTADKMDAHRARYAELRKALKESEENSHEEN